MPTRRSSLSPGYGYNQRSRRYVNLSTGRFASWERQVRPALDLVVDAARGRMGTLAVDLMQKRISLAEWQTGMMREIKTVHLASSAAAGGGWAQMTQADYGRVGARVRAEYGYLRDFAQQIERGQVRLDGRFLQRAGSYGNAGIATFENERQRRERASGARWEKNVLGAADHCRLCLEQTARGWVPVGALVPIGSRDCLMNDRCHYEYSDSLERPT